MAPAADDGQTSPVSVRPRIDGLSSGIKMLLILTAALLPLGLIALLASIQSANAKQAQRREDARVAATAEARQIDILMLRGMNLIRARLAAASPGISSDNPCMRSPVPDTTGFRMGIRFALYRADGSLRCASSGWRAGRVASPAREVPVNVVLLPGEGGLRFSVPGGAGTYGVAELPIELLRSVLPANDQAQGIVLTQGTSRLRLSSSARPSPLGEQLTVTAPVSNGQVRLELTVTTSRISAVEVLLVLLPLLMWAAAAGIAFVVLDQLLLRPIAQLQRAVAAYRPEQGALELPRLVTPAKEIRALGDAFTATTEEIIRREGELEEGLNRQVRLTREVHHRVKNNLQVVASLINLHSRGTQGEVQAAYASIQRRVDALAVVHRNHYAELEENRGVALRSIIAELSANLRGTAPAAAAHMTITLDMAPAFITQDVAVPVAFLVTEIVELVMNCDPTGGVAISLSPEPTPDRALLTIEAAGLAEHRCGDHPDREGFERIITGLSRQLRSQLVYDGTIGRYQIVISIVPHENDQKI